MFSSTARRLLQYVGGTKLTDLPKEWQTSVSKVLSEEERVVSTVTANYLGNIDPSFTSGTKDYAGRNQV